MLLRIKEKTKTKTSTKEDLTNIKRKNNFISLKKMKFPYTKTAFL